MKDRNDWHLLPEEQVLEALKTDMYKGLDEREARRRRRKFGSNSVWRVRHTSAVDAAKATLLDGASLLLVISAASAALFDKQIEAGAMIVLLLIGGFLRGITYIRANRILEGAARERIPVSSVIREGSVRLLPATEIVPGDIVFLEAGDTVPCDGRVVSGEDSVVVERGITENKAPVHKFATVIRTEAEGGEVPCEFRSNMLFAGSLVLSGSLRIAATACGEDALTVRKTGGCEIRPLEQLPVVEKLTARCRNTSLIMLAWVLILTGFSLFFGQNGTLPEVFLDTIAMAVAAMSEFLTTIGYIIVAVQIRDAADGGRRGDHARAILRDPARIEGAASPDILVFCGSSFFKSGRGELLSVRVLGKTFPKGSGGGDPVKRLLQLASAAAAQTNRGMAASFSPERVSVLEETVQGAIDAWVREHDTDFSSGSAVLDHADSRTVGHGMEISLIVEQEEVWAAACGPIDAILRCCDTAEGEDGGETLLTEELRRQIFTECAHLEYQGARIVAVARRLSPFTQLNRLPVLTRRMIFVGYFALAQETEADVKESVAYLRQRGIKPVLFTEFPEEDLYYCHRFGLFNRHTLRVNGSELSEELAQSLGADGMSVSFGDVRESELGSAYADAIRCLTAEDRTVAAVARNPRNSGVLSRADVGFTVANSDLHAVPECLSRHAASVIYPAAQQIEAGAGGIGGIVSAMRASVRILGNIRSAVLYMTTSQCARLLVLFAAIFFDVPLCSAVFILIWGLIFDFGAVLTMAFEKNDLPYKKTTPIPDSRRGVLLGAVWGGLLALLIPVTRGVLTFSGGAISEDCARSILESAVLLSGAVVAIGIMTRGGEKRRHFGTAPMFLVGGSILMAALVLYVPGASRFVAGSPCGGWISAAALVPALVLVLVFGIRRIVIRRKTAAQPT